MSERDRWLKALLGFLGEHRFAPVWALVCMVGFGLICLLYGLPMEAVLYAALLCVVAGLIGAALCFPPYLRRHASLEALARQAARDVSQLPAPRGLLQSDYDRLLRQALYANAEIAGEAKRAARAQLEIFSLWTHQIKVPISAMRLLLEQSASARDASLLAELFKIEQYASMALSYARMNASSTDYVLKEYDLDSMLRKLIRKFAPLFIQKKLALHYHPASLSVLTDEKWLLFALEQVLSNAVKYTRAGSVTIAVNPADATVTISDTGIGVAASDLPRVFDQGYTGYNGRGDQRATGLGLYLCRQALAGLGHTIALTSTVGQGTSVTVGLRRPDTARD